MDSLNARQFDSLCAGPKASPPVSVLRNEPLHRLFKTVGQAFHQHILHQMREEGITEVFPGALPLILHLGDEDGLHMSELSRRCGLENSTLTPLMDELERHNIASRERDPEDRRVLRIHLTAHGRELEPRLRALLLRTQETALHGISDSELDGLYRVLEHIASNLDTTP